MNTSKQYGGTAHIPGKIQRELHRHSPRRSSGVLRTVSNGLGRKVAPYFCQSLRSLAKICHAFRARTFEIFVSLRGYGLTHIASRACTRFPRLYTLRGAAVPRSLLFFVRAFDALAPPATPHASAHALTRTKSSSLIAKRVTRISFAIDGLEAFARGIAVFSAVRQDGLYHFTTLFACHSFTKTRSSLITPTIL